MIQQIVEKVPGVVPVTELEPTALFMYGKVLPVTREYYSNPMFFLTLFVNTNFIKLDPFL